MTEYVKRRRATGAQARMQAIPPGSPKQKPEVEVEADDDEFTHEELQIMFVGSLGCIFFLLVVIAILTCCLIWS